MENYLKLRKLKKKDALLMLAWMHDESVVKDMQTDFASKTLADCEQFILLSKDTSENLNLAIVNEEDTYLGTVSLKHITELNAEFAITIRMEAMGKGVSRFGMEEILKYGFSERKLSVIYWCVDPKNVRAVRFYDKNGYQRVSPERFTCVKDHYTEEQINRFFWYAVEKE